MTSSNPNNNPDNRITFVTGMELQKHGPRSSIIERVSKKERIESSDSIDVNITGNVKKVPKVVKN